jgi:hypothetical protein
MCGSSPVMPINLNNQPVKPGQTLDGKQVALDALQLP